MVTKHFYCLIFIYINKKLIKKMLQNSPIGNLQGKFDHLTIWPFNWPACNFWPTMFNIKKVTDYWYSLPIIPLSLLKLKLTRFLSRSLSHSYTHYCKSLGEYESDHHHHFRPLQRRLKHSKPTQPNPFEERRAFSQNIKG